MKTRNVTIWILDSYVVVFYNWQSTKIGSLKLEQKLQMS